MVDYTICDDWGEGSGLELHEKNCNEDQIGNKSFFFYQTYHHVVSQYFYHSHLSINTEMLI